ncbi:retinaldehyde-binding protein 1-like [Corticium candelabrum]|uniref:retinaldehyde-binding protein 1-like n=1 Tax=Corticium candelabrum TaxID=121492 RepID=UPI002E271EB5|nr:retinaldehyde-binding protein 1-like [Corticium candelabrum]
MMAFVNFEVEPELSSASLEKASRELNETDEIRASRISELKARVEQHEDELLIDSRRDASFLVRFLRARKFDVDRAYQLYVNYFKYRKDHPEIFKDKFTARDMREVLEMGLVSAGPKTKEEIYSVVLSTHRCPQCIFRDYFTLLFYVGNTSSLNFTPLVFEHFGTWGSEATNYLNKLARRSRDIEGYTNEADFRGFWRKNFSIILQGCNARVILHKLTRVFPGEEDENIHNRDYQSQQVICFQTGKWDLDKVSVTDIIRCLAMTMEAVIESPEVQVNGVVVVEDHAGMSIRHVFSMGSSDAKSVTQLMQDAFPARLKGIHIVHQGWFVRILFALVKPFLKSKMKERIFFHGTDYEKLHQLVDPANLPTSIGGQLANIDPTTWAQYLLKRESQEL